ncbi:hypothetical protein MMC25_001945 [Agyrium rufum]|nr:hypothetical protein [Agyrium rufum]
MTAVASPPSFQALPRMPWEGSDPMNEDSYSGFRRPPRTDSSTSSSSNSSASSTSSISTVSAKPSQPPSQANGHLDGWMSRKKAPRLFLAAKSEPVSGISDLRTNGLQSGPAAAPDANAVHHASSLLPNQNVSQAIQQSNNRAKQAQGNGETPIMLTLVPINGTFEKKQLLVPQHPESLKIGRQTNAKTLPSPSNGYFDSKVLSRQHAEIWSDPTGKIWIKDVKSSNGTFVNGQRLSLENRDSGPHQIRENATLELGIDIVSEDQKSIVHHKVSAKVEHAGPVSMSVLDVSFGDIDPASGNGLMSGPYPQRPGQVRGRGNSASSNGSTGRMLGPQGGAQMNGLAAQRQLNSLLNPITIEQVVKKLTVSYADENNEAQIANTVQSELKLAKQQSQALRQTDEFLHGLLDRQPGQDPPTKPPSLEKPPPESRVNGIVPATNLDAMSAFSQPPAPPPQQPLPEKPDSARSPNPEHASGQWPTPLPMDMAKSGSTASASSSPTKGEGKGIISLAKALNVAMQQIENQDEQVRYLKDRLNEESKARELAEEHNRRLLEGRGPNRSLDDLNALDFKPRDTEDDDGVDGTDKSVSASSSGTGGTDSPRSHADTEATSISSSPPRTTHDISASTARLQERLDAMVRDMDEMKMQMERYRQRAEAAEDDRSTLLQMIERIRKGEVDAAGVVVPDELKRKRRRVKSYDGEDTNDRETPNEAHWNGSRDTGNSEQGTDGEENEGETPSQAGRKHAENHTNGKAVRFKDIDDDNVISEISRGGSGQDLEDNRKALDHALTTLMKHPRSTYPTQQDMFSQAGPYASMLGVVLIGVGLMTWLNGWQKVDR